MSLALSHWLAMLAAAPLMVSAIVRTKAWFAGRQGAPWFQPYCDLARLVQKGAVYSRTTTWVFWLGSPAVLAAVVTASAFVPFGSVPAPAAFPGDLVMFAYLLGMARVATVLSALDTGSPFEGMGASRELRYSAMAEPVLLLALAALARSGGGLSLSAIYASVSVHAWAKNGPSLALAAAALAIVLLVENSRIPVDDPNTHLELTMIHEVMILDHGGPDLAAVEYAAALKLWLLGLLVAGVVPLRSGWFALDDLAAAGALLGVAGAVGAIESSMARLKLSHVPRLIAGAGALAALALVLTLE